MNNIVQDFNVDKLSKSPARFDPKKLEWFNQNFIQMMNLEEFVLRASLNRLEQQYPEANLRIGDYVLLVDLAEGKVFGQGFDSGFFGGNFYPVGGGRDSGEDSVTSLKREVAEELSGQVEIDESKLLWLGQLNVAREMSNFDGMQFNLYVYQINYKQIQTTIETDASGYSITYEWYNLQEVITGNRNFNYAVWKEFCENNNLPIFAPNEANLNQYLAYGLDQNRVTLLSQLGLESDCVNNYRPATLELLTWKKSDLAASLKNLQQISNFIFNESNWENLNQKVAIELGFDNTNSRNQNLLQAFSQNKLKQVLKISTIYWEELIKEFLTDSDMDFGGTLWPLRLALSGRERSPSPFELLGVLEYNEAQRRVREHLKN